MLFDFQVSLFINECDPTNAVIYDWQWLLDCFRRTGLKVIHTVAPGIRGHQWEIYLAKGSGNEFRFDASTMFNMCGTGIGEVDAGLMTPPGDNCCVTPER